LKTKTLASADIARHRRDRKGKTLPLINTDNTDQEKVAEIGKGRRRERLRSNISTILASRGFA